MSKPFRTLFQIFVLSFVFWAVTVTQAFAAPYGSGYYGENVYNVGGSTSPTPQPPSNNSSSSGAGTSAPATPTCAAPKPSSAPDLFQINSKGATGLVLFFSPVIGNRDSYFVSYGTTPSAEEFGFEFSNDAQAVIGVDVQALKPNTIYYVKVRAGNGCQPGDWSNILAARTGQRVPSYRWSSLPRIVSTSVHQKLAPSAVQRVTVDTSASPVPAGSTTPAAQPSAPSQPVSAPPIAPESPSFLQRVSSFFRGILGR